MSKRIVEIKGYDNSTMEIEINPTYLKKKWKEGKCWAIWCSNPFYYIHFTRFGRATHAYCPHQWGRFEMYQYGEKWGHIEQGKLIIDAEKIRKEKNNEKI